MNDKKQQTALEQYKRTGNIQYKEAAIKEYARLVKLIASQLYAKNSMYILEKEDYESYGVLGLLDAIEKYDFSTDIKFETYASHRIRGSILDGLRNIDQLKRGTRQNQKQYRQMEIAATESYGPNYTREQFMLANKLTETELLKLEEDVALSEAVSLDGLFHTGDSDADTFDVKDNSKFGDGEQKVLHDALAEALSMALNCLTEKERRVIELIYYEDLTQNEIAQILGVTESRVSQLHRKALNKMKRNAHISEWVN